MPEVTDNISSAVITNHEIFKVLRNDDIDQILKEFEKPDIKHYVVSLQPGTEDHDHFIRLLDLKLDIDQARLVCEIFERIGIDFLAKISSKVKLCRAVAQTINIDRKLMLFHYTTLSQSLRLGNKNRPACPSDVLPIIYGFLEDDSLPIAHAKMQEAATTDIYARLFAFGRSRII